MRKTTKATLAMMLALTCCACAKESDSTTTEQSLEESTSSNDAQEAAATDEESAEASGEESQEGESGEKPDDLPSGEEPGEMPGGEMPSGEKPSGDPGEMPSGEDPGANGGGEKPSGDPGEMPSGEMPTGEDPGANGGGGEKPDDMPGGGGTGGGQSSGVDSYDSANSYTEDTSLANTSLDSTGTDENAVLVSEGAAVSMSKVTIDRTSSDSTGGDNSSFYGVGAAALVTEGTLSITDSTITTDAAGGAGVFAYGDGVAYVSDTTITTKQDTSGGIHVAGGGTLYAWDLTVSTDGNSSAAIRSDRGSGTMVVDGGSYTSNGTGSPAVYSTADITVNDAELTATASEAICIEGLNTIRLFDCDLSGNMADQDQNDCTWNVILYQSMSGDSEQGNSTFEMVGGSLTAKNGGMFYTTNTESTFILSDVDITYASDSEFFLKCTGNANERGWGSSGSNGADCSFTAIDQEMEGTVIWDSISQLDFYMTDGSTLTGSFTDDETNAGNGGDGYASVYIDESSTWIVTDDSEVTNLYCEGTIKDSSGKTVSIVDSDGNTLVSGTSSYTITVENYSTDADLSGASETDSFSDYEVDKQ